MYKKVFSISGEPISLRFNALIKMKLTLVFIFLLNMTALASFGQRITLSEHQSSLNNVLKKIKNQTSYDFMISSSLLQLARPVSITVSNAHIEDVMQRLFEDQPLEYEIVKNAVLVTRKKEVKENLMKVSAVNNQKSIIGRVVDQNNKGIAGVTIVVKGETIAVTSDDQGNFILPDAAIGQTIRITSVGYNRHEVVAVDKMVIKLTVKSTEIDEVVSVGYGTIKRKDLTGSIASVDVDEVKNTPFVSIDQALAGKAAGVQVVQADGSPGGVAKIRIRGGTSLVGGNDPLYIIDGIQVSIQNRYVQAAADIVSPVERLGKDDQMNTAVGASFARGLNSLAGLNINDIESIDILKDASATAIYGSRAANGVVIITTKKGKLNQKPVLEANYYTGIGKAITEELLNTQEYRDIMLTGAKNLNDLRKRAGLGADDLATSILNDPSLLGKESTDWIDFVTRTGRSQNADISVRGGGAGSRYYTSLAFVDQKGTLVGTDFSRISGKVNLDNEITSRVRLITNLDYGFTKNNITNGIYSSAIFAPPTLAPYSADGTPSVFNSSTYGFSASMGIQNPAALLTGKNESKNNMLLGSMALEFSLLKNLKFRSTVSANYNNYHQLNYIPSTAMVSAANGAVNSNGGIASQGYTNQLDMFYENNLTWEKQFNESNRINVLAGTTWQQSNTSLFSASGQGFPDDYFLNGLTSAAIPMPPKASESQSSLLSFYLRVNYALKERYLLTLTGRSDESSKFPKKNRTGYFPSFGIAWRASQENFLKNVTWLNELKFRASAGRTGTQNLGNNLFYTLYTPASYAGTNALLPSQLGNDKIKWESTNQIDFGLDFELFSSRLRGAFGYYEKNTSDLLFSMNTALSSGFNTAMMNVAAINNKGVEFDLRGDIIRTKFFNWNLALNISTNHSKVTKINRDVTNPSAAAKSDSYRNEQTLGNTILREGESVGLIYGYIFNGVIKSQEELLDYKAQSVYAQLGLLSNLDLGYPMYALHTEGNNKGYFKRDVIGNAQPDYFGGITNSITYKSFNVIALTTFSKGGDILYLPDNKSFGLSDRGNRNTRILLPSYSMENTDANRPSIVLKESNTSGTGVSSANVFDASYIKLKSISINYMLPKKMMSKLHVANAMVYVSGSNLFAITNYPGPDPEISNNPYSLIGGYSDSAAYPTVRQYTLGVRFGF